jgi:hypothetical protein
MPQLKGLSPLAAYIEDNKDSGCTIEELILQFQEFDCEHEEEYAVAISLYTVIFCCDRCGRLEKQARAVA